MFHPDLISSLFGNIEDILRFQESFLRDLTEAVDMKVRDELWMHKEVQIP